MSVLSKYLTVADNMIQNYLIYRINFVFWRLQVFVSFLIFYFLWNSIAEGKNSIGVYTADQILAYFIIGYIIRALVFSTRTADLGGEIQTGALSSRLLKPMGVIKYYFSVDVIDKIFNLFLMTFEFSLVLLLFKPRLTLPSWPDLAFFAVSLTIAVVFFFFYSLIVSIITFWSDQAWSSRYLLGVVFVNLLSGQYIPLDLLPSRLSTFISYTPFPYFYYYPLRFWLQKESLTSSWQITILSLLNLIFYFLLSTLLWQRGKLKYQSYGH